MSKPSKGSVQVSTLLCGQSELKTGPAPPCDQRTQRQTFEKISGQLCSSNSQPRMFLVRQGDNPERGRSKTFAASQAHANE